MAVLLNLSTLGLMVEVDENGRSGFFLKGARDLITDAL